jgi:L-asparaginase/Glu-tRNA(Gln) amidotransferase subunit D
MELQDIVQNILQEYNKWLKVKNISSIASKKYDIENTYKIAKKISITLNQMYANGHVEKRKFNNDIYLYKWRHKNEK